LVLYEREEKHLDRYEEKLSATHVLFENEMFNDADIFLSTPQKIL
jgi:hypothetical protein